MWLCKQVCTLGSWEGDVQRRGGTLGRARDIVPKDCETSEGRDCVYLVHWCFTRTKSSASHILVIEN